MPGVRAAAKSPRVGTPLRRSPLPVFHRFERTRASGQCWKACSTSITITVVGSFPSTAKRRLRAGSTLTRARPLTRPICFIRSGDQEDQCDARVLYQVFDAIDAIVAAPIGDQQYAAVIIDLNEPGLVAF